MENNKKTVAEITSAEPKPTSEELIANVIPEDGGIEIKDDKKEKKRSDGGKIVTAYDLLHSDKLEVVQLYGMDPREFLKSLNE